MRGHKEHGYTIFYVAIVICLIVSGVAVYGLVNKLDTYRESEDSYAELQAQALYTMPPTDGATAAATSTATDALAAVTPAPTQTDEAAEDELEGEEIEDDALFWLLGHQNSTWQTITPETSQNIAIASTTNTVSASGRAEQSAAPDTTVTPDTRNDGDEISAAKTTSPADVTATPAPTDGEAADSKPSETPSASPQATQSATPAPTLEPIATPSPEPKPTATEAPFFMPKDGISMERAVTYEKARYSVDFDYLSRINDDIVGWLMEEGTDINYPIVRGDDNLYYLTHMIDGTKNQNGTLFMDCGNSAAFIDEGSYVYGHNSKNGGMFALLSNYVEQEYYDEHSQMFLMSPFADYQIDIFAGIQTTVEDETSWRIKLFTESESFDDYIDGICKQSMFTASKDLRPMWGDKLLVLVTCTNIEHGARYVIYGRMRPIVYESTESVELTKRELDSIESISGYKQVGPLGKMMVYAQNDPIWNDMRYETRKYNKRRPFGDGGCGPTAVAMAIANLVAPEKLPLLIGFADYDLGYTFCQCSVNRYYCNHLHSQYHLKTAEEFLRYMPVAVANYASGNNMWGVTSRGDNRGTSMRFLESMCLIYRIRLSATYDLEEALDKLRQGDSIVIVSTSRGPYTKLGHYLVMAGVDDEYMYVLDPFSRDSYAGNYRSDLIEILEPGVTRVKLEDAEQCLFSTLYILEKTPET